MFPHFSCVCCEFSYNIISSFNSMYWHCLHLFRPAKMFNNVCRSFPTLLGSESTVDFSCVFQSRHCSFRARLSVDTEICFNWFTIKNWSQFFNWLKKMNVHLVVYWHFDIVWWFQKNVCKIIIFCDPNC